MNDIRDKLKPLVAALFTNGVGEHGDRLVLVDKQGRDLGGWVEQAVVDFIATRLPIEPVDAAPGKQGVDLDFFCIIVKHFNKRYPNRAASAALNDFIPTLMKIEAMFERLPVVEPRKKTRKEAK